MLRSWQFYQMWATLLHSKKSKTRCLRLFSTPDCLPLPKPNVLCSSQRGGNACPIAPRSLAQIPTCSTGGKEIWLACIECVLPKRFLWALPQLDMWNQTNTIYLIRCCRGSWLQVTQFNLDLDHSLCRFACIFFSSWWGEPMCSVCTSVNQRGSLSRHAPAGDLAACGTSLISWITALQKPRDKIPSTRATAAAVCLRLVVLFF